MSNYNSKLPVFLLCAFVAPFIPQSESAAAPEESIEASEELSLDAFEGVDESIEASEDESIEASEDLSAGSDELLTDEDSMQSRHIPKAKSLQVCNSRLFPVRTAIMLRRSGKWVTVGWKVINPNKCKAWILNYSGSFNMYVYAETLGKIPLVPGTTGGCVDDSPAFKYRSKDLCTGGTRRWVNFLRRPAPNLPGWWTLSLY